AREGRPARDDRVHAARRRQRLRRAGEGARRPRARPGRAREPDPVQPLVGLGVRAVVAPADRVVQGGPRAAGRLGVGALQPRPRRRRGPRAARAPPREGRLVHRQGLSRPWAVPDFTGSRRAGHIDSRPRLGLFSPGAHALHVLEAGMFIGKCRRTAVVALAVAAATLTFGTAAAQSNVAQLRAEVQANPGSVVAWVALGNALYQSGQFDEAKEAFLEAIALDYRSGDAHYGLGLAEF